MEKGNWHGVDYTISIIKVLLMGARKVPMGHDLHALLFLDTIFMTIRNRILV